MRYQFKNSELRRLYQERGYRAGYPEAVVKAFRRRVQAIANAVDERDLRAMKSHHFEKLKGDRSHQYSLRLNDQFRLLLQIVTESNGKVIWVIDIEDYH